jgi:hypothetical protein
LPKSKRKERCRLHGKASVETQDKKSSNLSMQQDTEIEKLSRQQADVIGQERPARTRWSGAITRWKDESGEAASSDDAASMV